MPIKNIQFVNPISQDDCAKIRDIWEDLEKRKKRAAVYAPISGILVILLMMDQTSYQLLSPFMNATLIIIFVLIASFGLSIFLVGNKSTKDRLAEERLPDIPKELLANTAIANENAARIQRELLAGKQISRIEIDLPTGTASVWLQDKNSAFEDPAIRLPFRTLRLNNEIPSGEAKFDLTDGIFICRPAMAQKESNACFNSRSLKNDSPC